MVRTLCEMCGCGIVEVVWWFAGCAVRTSCWFVVVVYLMICRRAVDGFEVVSGGLNVLAIFNYRWMCCRGFCDVAVSV